MEEEIKKEIIKQAEGTITEVYKDALSQSVQPLGTVLSYLPRSIRLAFGRWEKWIINGEESLKVTSELLKEKVNKIPKEKLCEPEPYVAIPAIQQISYCENSDELRNLYANLLASSMNSDKKWNVHPSFVDIIKQLNPDEAKILKNLIPNIMMNYPLINVKLKQKNVSGSHILISNFTDIGINNLDNPANICSYIDNLERLRIIDIPANLSISDKTKYKSLKGHSLVKNSIPKNYEDNFNIDYEEKIFKLTNFGVNFINTCVK